MSYHRTALRDIPGNLQLPTTSDWNPTIQQGTKKLQNESHVSSVQSFADWDPSHRRLLHLNTLTKREQDCARKELLYTSLIRSSNNQPEGNGGAKWRDRIVLDLSLPVQQSTNHRTSSPKPAIATLKLQIAESQLRRVATSSSRTASPKTAIVSLNESDLASPITAANPPRRGATIMSPNPNSRPASPVRSWEPRGQYASQPSSRTSSPTLRSSSPLTAAARCQALYEHSKLRDMKMMKNREINQKKELGECTFQPRTTPYRRCQAPSPSPPNTPRPSPRRAVPIPSPAPRSYTPVGSRTLGNALSQRQMPCAQPKHSDPHQQTFSRGSSPLPSKSSSSRFERSCSGLSTGTATSITSAAPLLFMDVTIGDPSNGPKRIAIHAHDTPEQLARNFAITNLLTEQQEKKLLQMIQQTLSQMR
eukprot:PhF_6_TR14211/c0_g1_i1/m.22786